jgi:tRNA 2-thiouridine synthesizing protein A
MTNPAIHLDLRGLKCPMPVLRTRKLLNKLEHGALAIIACTDPLAVIDIPHLVRSRGDVLEFKTENDGVLIFHIRRQRPKEDQNGR